MNRQSGNFLMQALLALTLIFAFIPFVAQRLARYDTDANMAAAVRQVESASTAAQIYVRANAAAFLYDQTVLAGDAFADTLESYGLPLGFVPHTPLGQDMSLVIDKDSTGAVSAQLVLRGGNLSGISRAELIRRIGFYATSDGDDIVVGVPLDAGFSDVVRRSGVDLDSAAFLTDLDMGDFSLSGGGTLFARRGEFDSAQVGTLTITGVENGRKVRSTISRMNTDRAIFQSRNGESALALTRGGLVANSISARTVAAFGDAGNFTSRVASVYDFSMTAGRTGFTGPADWYVGGSVITDRITFNTERLEIGATINASRGQDVYINPDDLEYSNRSGIDVSYLTVSNITLRDQTSDALLNGQTGAVVLDIRPAGTSVLPDVLIDYIDNGATSIIAKASDDDGRTVDCRSIISALNGNYNQKSLAQYLICQYVFWQRLEQRIDIKQCIMDGRSGCY